MPTPLRALLAALATLLLAAASAAAGVQPLARVPGQRVIGAPGARGAFPQPALGARRVFTPPGDVDGEYVNTFWIDPITMSAAPATAHSVGFYQAADGMPRVGDIFYVHMWSGVLDTGDAPAMNLVFDPGLAADTRWAISQANAVHCFYRPNGGSYQDDPAHCSTSPGVGAYGWFFGGRALATGDMFDIRVPIQVTRPRSGIATGSAALFAQETTVALGSPSPVLARQWLFVFDRAPEIGNFATPTLAAAKVRLQADVYPFWQAGTAYLDLGRSAGHYAFPGTPLPLTADSPGFRVFEDFGGLHGSTTYHWRVRLVIGGVTRTSPDQTFTTPAGAGTGTPHPTGDVKAPAVTLALPACRPGQGAAACRALRATRAAWRTVRGAVTDPAPSSGIARVELTAISRKGGVCRVATASTFARVPCGTPPTWLRATVAHGRWSRALAGLPAGTLTVTVRATDRRGLVSRAVHRSAVLR